ncbi:MAG: GNAT family N-acetyltransferase [Pyrinomonadaceae bacterium]
MNILIRKARTDDAEELAALIAESVRELAKGFYTNEQIEHSIRTVFGVDHQLIEDGTYFVAELGGRMAGCGGWSKRKTLFGASAYEGRDPELLDPDEEPAKIRAFFVHPDMARRGVGSAILERCETEARTFRFRSAEMMATLPGVPLYEVRGYRKIAPRNIPIGDGVEIECIIMRKELV